MGSAARAKAACLRFVEVDGPQNRIAEHEPTYRLDAIIAQRRAEMGEDRWQRLNEEWSAA